MRIQSETGRYHSAFGMRVLLSVATVAFEMAVLAWMGWVAVRAFHAADEVVMAELLTVEAGSGPSPTKPPFRFAFERAFSGIDAQFDFIVGSLERK